jgi:acyl carrier protein
VTEARMGWVSGEEAGALAEREERVLAEIRRIAAEELDFHAPIEPHHELLKDLQLDSMGLTVMAVGLENRFRVRLSEEDSARVTTVGDLVQLVAQRTGLAGGGP